MTHGSNDPVSAGTAAGVMGRHEVAILVVQSSAGEVDWILPVLKRLRDGSETRRVVTVFESRRAFEGLRRNVELFSLWRGISDFHLLPPITVEQRRLFRAGVKALGVVFNGAGERLRRRAAERGLERYLRDLWRLLDSELPGWSANLVFDQAGSPSPLAERLCRRLRDPLLVRFPHAAHIYSAADLVGGGGRASQGLVREILLVGSERELEYWGTRFDRDRIRVCGYPKYDPWWVDLLLRSADAEAAPSAAPTEGPRIAVALRGPHKHYLSRAEFASLVCSVMDVVMPRPNAVALFKLHPRQNREEAEAVLADYPRSRWRFTERHPIRLARNADVFITFWSCAALDALAVETPAVELWPVQRCTFQQVHTEDGGWTTIYRLLGLAAGADTTAELAELVGLALDHPEHERWQSQRRSFAAQCVERVGAVDGAAAMIRAELEAGTSSATGRVGQRELLRP